MKRFEYNIKLPERLGERIYRAYLDLKHEFEQQNEAEFFNFHDFIILALRDKFQFGNTMFDIEIDQKTLKSEVILNEKK